MCFCSMYLQGLINLNDWGSSGIGPPYMLVFLLQGPDMYKTRPDICKLRRLLSKKESLNYKNIRKMFLAYIHLYILSTSTEAQEFSPSGDSVH